MKNFTALFILSIGILATEAGVAQAAIVTRTFSNLVLDATQPGGGKYNLDLDLNGTTDFTFENFYSNDPAFILGFAQTKVPFGSNNGVVIDFQDNSGFPPARLLNAGAVVGPASLFSNSNDTVNLYSSDPFIGPTGNFGGKRGFLGLRFVSGGQLLYGFADIAVNDLNSAKPFDLTIFSASYETIAGQGAVVAVPEPATGVILLLGILGAALVHRTRKRTSPI